MGRLITVQGDLLKSECHFIAHQANCQKTMGAGLAKQIRETYPEAYSADLADGRTPHERLGGISHAYIKRDDVYVFNLYGQFGFGRDPNEVYTDHASLAHALSSYFRYATTEFELSLKPDFLVGLPYGIGAGLANGSWPHIYTMIHDMVKHLPYDVHLYALDPLPFRVVIAGGRDFRDIELLAHSMDLVLSKKIRDGHEIIVISGGATGADALGEAYAKLRGYKVELYPANWAAFGKKAGPMRNACMANAADAVCVFWDGESRGTLSMINETKSLDKPIRVFSY